MLKRNSDGRNAEKKELASSNNKIAERKMKKENKSVVQAKNIPIKIYIL